MSSGKHLNAEQTAQKQAAIEQLFEQTESYLQDGVNRQSLEQVMNALIALASHQEWWCLDEYEEPDNEQRQNRYLIYQASDDGVTLYLNVMKPGKKIVPHDHTTWACIAGVVGTETNFVYERLDDGSVPGKATLKQSDTILVGPGSGIALLADDIHAVKIEDTVIRHLHFYGRPLEQLTERKAFNLEDNSYTTKDIGVQSR
ncbi:hypothetical protein AAEX37_00324 [Oligella sp. MSHR50489EDL]|uniref:cysteine dioxygenase family protein n=1 Tax=Oligella sp. MSHR50489EDL TaxID=3139409 RepID=UPI003D813AB2